MKLAIIILIVLLLVVVLTCLVCAAVDQYRTERRQWRTECQELKKKYDNEVEHREWALSHLKAQTTRADYLQGELDKATRMLNVAEWRKNKKNNKKTKDNGKQSKAD